MNALRRIYLLLLLASALLIAQALPGTLGDFTGDGAKHQLATTKTGARAIQFICSSTNSAVIRFGDSNISSTRGDKCAPGGGLFKPPLSNSPTSYDLSTWYYLAGSGDTFSVSYVK